MKKITQLLRSKWREYLIEIIVIIVGILLAIALNNWNEKRKELVEEQIILKDLQRDFQDNLLQLQQKLEVAKRSDASIEKVVHTLVNKEKDSISSTELELLGAALVIRTTFDPKTGSMNEILGSGKLRVIQNKELRNKLSAWSSHLAEVTETEIRLKEADDRIYDYLFDNFPIADLFEIIPNWRKIKFKSKFSTDAMLIYKDRKFENILSLKSRWHQYLFRRYDILEQEIQEVLSLIEKEIN